MIMQEGASRGWDIDSLDVSTAFLQGFRFSDLQDIGVNRQPCAFCPPEGTFALLAEIDPETWSEAAKFHDLYCYELAVAAYGLKDAPLLWYLRFRAWFIANYFVPQRHDQCRPMCGRDRWVTQHNMRRRCSPPTSFRVPCRPDAHHEP